MRFILLTLCLLPLQLLGQAPDVSLEVHTISSKELIVTYVNGSPSDQLTLSYYTFVGDTIELEDGTEFFEEEIVPLASKTVSPFLGGLTDTLRRHDYQEVLIEVESINNSESSIDSETIFLNNN